MIFDYTYITEVSFRKIIGITYSHLIEDICLGGYEGDGTGPHKYTHIIVHNITLLLMVYSLHSCSHHRVLVSKKKKFKYMRSHHLFAEVGRRESTITRFPRLYPTIFPTFPV
jgi:hypothetical protein